MSKMLDVIMAGVISGIVAFTTSKIGIAGTVLGAVLGAMLYQFMSHYVKEPLGNVKTRKIETRVVYAIPLILILAIEIIYIFSAVYWKPEQIFYYLENVTDWNLFRSIGIGLICMGIYPLLISENIKQSYGYVILSVGIIILLNGFVDANISRGRIICSFICRIRLYNFFRSYSCIIICYSINNSRISSY